MAEQLIIDGVLDAESLELLKSYLHVGYHFKTCSAHLNGIVLKTNSKLAVIAAAPPSSPQDEYYIAKHTVGLGDLYLGCHIDYDNECGLLPEGVAMSLFSSALGRYELKEGLRLSFDLLLRHTARSLSVQRGGHVLKVSIDCFFM